MAQRRAPGLGRGAPRERGAARRTSAKTIALAFGLTYGAVAVYGIIAGDDVIGLIPVNGPDHVLHVLLAAAGLLAAFASPRGEPLQTTTTAVTGTTPAGDPAAARRPADVEPISGAPRDRDAPTR